MQIKLLDIIMKEVAENLGCLELLPERRKYYLAKIKPGIKVCDLLIKGHRLETTSANLNLRDKISLMTFQKLRESAFNSCGELGVDIFNGLVSQAESIKDSLEKVINHNASALSKEQWKICINFAFSLSSILEEKAEEE